jgi:hypothetical protein
MEKQKVSTGLRLFLLASILFSTVAQAKDVDKAKTLPIKKTVAVSKVAPAVAREPAAVDPNRAIEIRGQSRTLSMMLVLKNGKENINFIRVRKDYNEEIRGTDF